MWFKGHAIENIRIYIRFIYCIFIWYEIALSDLDAW
jgi:hypothetical protein